MQVHFNVRSFLDRAACTYPERVALVDEPDQPAEPWAALTFAELADRARARRKLMGTRIRPHPDTPKNEARSRDELCDTTATRSPGPMPSRSSPAAWARARSASSAKVSAAHGSAGWSGSSTIAIRSGYVHAARSRKSRTLNSMCMVPPRGAGQGPI